MSEKIILNLDDIKPSKKFIKFNNKEFEIIEKTVEEATEILFELTNQKDDKKLYMYVLEQCIPSIIPEIINFNDNQSKELISRILNVCFRIDITTARELIETETKKKTLN